jgi:hypothetical protein
MTNTPDPKENEREERDPYNRDEPMNAPGDPDAPAEYELEPEDFAPEGGEEDVRTDPPETVEESFQPTSDQDIENNGEADKD